MISLSVSATKTDLRNEDGDTISPSEGRKLRKKIKATRVMECSAKNGEGLSEIFVEAVKSAVNKNKRRFCVYL